MRRIALLVTALAATILLTAPYQVAARRSPVDLGDYWQYEGSAGQSELVPGTNSSLTFSYREDITTDVTKDVDGASTAAFECKTVMNGTTTYNQGGLTSTGSFQVTAFSTHLKSNFSLVSESYVMRSLTMGLTVAIGANASYDPPLDNYVGDEKLSVGRLIRSNSSVTISGWMDFFGFNTTINSSSSQQNFVAEVMNADVQVVVPAGAFICYKLEVVENGTMATWYYSDEVGNYVKMEGLAGGGLFGSSGNMELVAYSHNSGGFPVLIVVTIVGVVVAVAVIAAIVLWLAGKKRMLPANALEAQPSSIVTQPPKGPG